MNPKTIKRGIPYTNLWMILIFGIGLAWSVPSSYAGPSNVDDSRACTATVSGSVTEPTGTEQILQAVSAFSVLELCKTAIDKTKKESIWGGWKPCFCGAKEGTSSSLTGLGQLVRHPWTSLKALANAMANFNETAKKVDSYLRKAFAEFPDLSFEEQKAVRCYVLTSIGTDVATGVIASAVIKRTIHAAISTVKGMRGATATRTVTATGELSENAASTTGKISPKHITSQKIRLTNAEYSAKYPHAEVSKQHAATGLSPQQVVDVTMKDGSVVRGLFWGGKDSKLIIKDLAFEKQFGEWNGFAEIDLANIKQLKARTLGIGVDKNKIFGLRNGEKIRVIEQSHPDPALKNFTKYERIEGVVVQETSEFIELKATSVIPVRGFELHSEGYKSVLPKNRTPGQTVRLWKGKNRLGDPNLTALERTVLLPK